MSDSPVVIPGAPPRPAASAPRRFYVPQLDGLRFTAFLLVFLHHGPQLSRLFRPGSLPFSVLDFLERRGWFGVDLFLVLSAFLITSLLLIEHERYGAISLRGFYLRRILRIWPLYYLMTLVGFFLLPWLSLFAMPLDSPQHAQLMRDHFLAYCTLFGNFSSGAHGYPTVPTLAHLWTVTLEEQFYIVWPLTLSIFLRLRKQALWALLLASLAGTIALRMHLVGGRPHPYIWTNTFARLDPLIIGIAIALWRKVHPGRPGWIAPVAKFLLGAAVIASTNLGPEIQTQSRSIGWEFLATAVGCGLVLDALLASGNNPLRWLFARRPMVWLGKLTYGLYVYHVLGLEMGQEVVTFLQNRRILTGAASGLVGQSIAGLVITIIIAAESYRLFESFFLRQKDRFSRIKSRPIEAGADASPVREQGRETIRGT
jgi:peptidoglycan/LPS O-acetylase OafA/YrhL